MALSGIRKFKYFINVNDEFWESQNWVCQAAAPIALLITQLLLFWGGNEKKQMGLEFGGGGRILKTPSIVSSQTGTGDSLSPRTAGQGASSVLPWEWQSWKTALGASPVWAGCGRSWFLWWSVM